MEYYEKREYNDGCKYVRVSNLVPGISYYTKGTDEYNQLYFSPVHNPSMTSTVVPMMTAAMTDMSGRGGGGGGGCTFVNYYPPPSTLLNMNSTSTRSLIIPEAQNEIEKAKNLHLAVSITSIFIPALVYLICFPFCFVQLRNLAKKSSSNGNIEKNMKNYTAVGWTAWVLHLACLITFATFWIPTCHTEPRYYSYYNYYYNYDDSGYFLQSICHISTAGFVMVGLIPVFTLIFTIVLCVLGVVFFEDLKNGDNFCTNQVTVE
jgi:hypothetical protein